MNQVDWRGDNTYIGSTVLGIGPRRILGRDGLHTFKLDVQFYHLLLSNVVDG